MKAGRLIVAVIISAVLLASCKGSNEDSTKPIVDGVLLKYPQDSYTYNIANSYMGVSIDVDESVYLYVKAITSAYPDTAFEMNSQYISKYDKNGELTEEYVLKNIKSVQAFTVTDDKVYFTAYRTEQDGGDLFLGQYDKTSKEQSELIALDEFERSTKLEITDGMLYLMLEDDIRTNPVALPYYGGGVLCRFDLKTSEFSEIPTDNPQMFAKTLDNNLMIFGFDAEKGAYFSEYDIKSKEFSSKLYNDQVGNIRRFEVINSANDIVFAYSRDVMITDLKSDNGITVAIENCGSFSYEGGYLFYTEEEMSEISPNVMLTEKVYIHRQPLEDLYKPAQRIIMITVSEMYEEPSAIGYTLSVKALSGQAYATKVMSGSDDYEICAVNSYSDSALRIREQKAYLPLNDIPGVEEYIDKCHPYIKEAVTNENGYIWALPVFSSISCVLYNADKCEQKGISAEDFADYKKIYPILDNIGAGNYALPPYMVIESLTQQYLNENGTLDTDDFRQICSDFKVLFANSDKYNFTIQAFSSNSIFNASRYSKEQVNGAYNDSIAPIAKLSENSKYPVRMIMLCLNPSAKNIDTAKEYISSMADSCLNDTQNVILNNPDEKENEYEKAVFEIYKNGFVDIGSRFSVAFEDIYKYLDGETDDLETAISESSRKLSMYMSE